MPHFFRNIPPLRTLPKKVEADCFNTVCLALRRLGGPPLVVQPHGLGLVEVVLDRRRWVCVEEAGNKLPLLEWTDFTTQGRALHAPVPCVLHLYHVHAGLLMGAVLEGTRYVLAQRLEHWRAAHR